MSKRVRLSSQTQPPPPPRPQPTTAVAAASLSRNPSTSSKIPFRARKARKLTAEPLKTLAKPPQILKPLSSDGEIELALGHLRVSDPSLASLIASLPPPSFESSARPFLALAKSILFQQLATGAARTIFGRFLSLCGGETGVSPESLLALSAQQLRGAGVSGRKASYLRDLAENYQSGALSDESILEMDDEGLLGALTRVKGIGVWSVHMFMIFSLHRPDVLPVGDLGVRKGLQGVYKLKDLPKPLEMEELCEKWRPYRSVGSWYMWRFMESMSTAAAAKS